MICTRWAFVVLSRLACVHTSIAGIINDLETITVALVRKSRTASAEKSGTALVSRSTQSCTAAVRSRCTRLASA